jgi:hypothetical protein
MNWKKFILLSCLVSCIFAVSSAAAQMRGRGRAAPTARMPMRGAPMLNSASGFRHPFFNDRREDRLEARRPFFNDRREDRFEARRFFPNRFVNNRFVFVGDFGFPWWWGWGWGPWSWGWGYPYSGYPYGYGYYGYGDPYGYGYGYGGGDYQQYSDSSRSRVGELQRRLARAGYYHGAIDGILGPATRRAIRAYERDHGYVS